MRLVVLCLLMVVSYFSFAEKIAIDKLTIVAAEHKLLQYRNEDQLHGPSAEILKLLLEQEVNGDQVQFMPWSRAFSRVKTTPNTLILSMVRTQEREPHFHWITKVSELTRAFISLKQSPENEVKVFDEARSKITAVVRETYSHNSLVSKGFSEHENLYLVHSLDAGIRLLINGKVDLIYTEPSVLINYYANKGLIAEDYISYTILPETHREAFIAVHVDTDPDIVKQLKRNNRNLVSTEAYKYHLAHKPLISDK